MKMKREIKFRVWNDISKSWLNSYYSALRCNSADENIVLISNDIFSPYDKYHQSQDLVIQQFTGFKDKNGKEIYEGDIVYDRVTADHNDKRMDFFEVSYNDEYSAFVLLKKPNEDGWRSWNWIRNIGYCGQVVGNIFENPKLIKKPKKNKVV